MSLSQKNFENAVHHITETKLVQRIFSTNDSGKRSSEKMCLQPTLKVPSVCDAVTLDGKLFQTCGAATKTEEGPITNRRTTRWRRYESRRWRRTQPSSCVDVRHTTQLVRQVRRSRTMQTAEHEHSELKLNLLAHRNQWRSWSSGVMCSYFRAEQTSRAAALITDCSLSSWLPGRPASVALP